MIFFPVQHSPRFFTPLLLSPQPGPARPLPCPRQALGVPRPPAEKGALLPHPRAGGAHDQPPARARQGLVQVQRGVPQVSQQKLLCQARCYRWVAFFFSQIFKVF